MQIRSIVKESSFVFFAQKNLQFVPALDDKSVTLLSRVANRGKALDGAMFVDLDANELLVEVASENLVDVLAVEEEKLPILEEIAEGVQFLLDLQDLFVQDGLVGGERLQLDVIFLVFSAHILVLLVDFDLIFPRLLNDSHALEDVGNVVDSPLLDSEVLHQVI